MIKLVKASIEDADAKYSALWKLYVFVSDGLYYTGILNKLKLVSGDAEASASHVSRLKSSEALVVAALEVICEDWSKYCREVAGTSRRQTRLVEQMTGD